MYTTPLEIMTPPHIIRFKTIGILQPLRTTIGVLLPLRIPLFLPLFVTLFLGLKWTLKFNFQTERTLKDPEKRRRFIGKNLLKKNDEIVWPA